MIAGTVWKLLPLMLGMLGVEPGMVGQSVTRLIVQDEVIMRVPVQPHPFLPEIARIPLVRAEGAPARPKGTFVTADGRFAVVTGGANTLKAQGQTPTGTVFVIDLHKQAQVATVTKVGIDPYNLVIAEDVDD